MSISIGTQTIGGASGSVVAASITDASATGVSVLTGTAAQGRTALSVPPASRIVGGLDLSADRSAADLMTSLGASSYASGLDAARPAASSGIVGQLYYATDSGVTYRCVSSTTWRVVGARGAVEGFDTTAVALSGVNATGNTTINAGVVLSIVCTFAMPSSPSGVGIIASGGEWQLEIGNNSGDRYQLSLNRAGFGTARVTLGTVSGSPTTLHTVAITFSGTTTRYSMDGGAVQTASHVSGSASGNAALKFSSGGFPSVAQVTSLTLFSTGLSDADLVIASAAYATGRIPAVTGTLYSLWHAGWFTAAVLTQQMQVGVLGGALTWGNGFPLVLK